MFRMIAAAALLLAVPVRAVPLAEITAGRAGVGPQLSGLVAIVSDRRGIVRAEAHGDAVIGVRPLTIDTPMRVASISKAVVAIAVLRLVEQGKLDLDADVLRWLGWRLRNPAFPDAPVTLRQLLSHTSGIDDGSGYRFPLGTGLRAGMTADHWSAQAPGARFAYANLNYGIIATVMEAATGERFDRLMTRLVLAPLKLDAGYNWSGASDAAIANAAVLYRKGADETAWNPAGPWIAQADDLHGVRPACPVASADGCELAAYRPGDNGTLFSPQGGLRISARGLATIGRMLLRGGEVDGVRLLRPASVRAMLVPAWRAGRNPADDTYHGQMLCYGAGLHCLSGRAGASDQPVAGAKWWGHLGEAYGLLGGLWVDRDHGRVLVYLLTGSADDPMAGGEGFSRVETAILRELATPLERREQSRGETR